MAGSFGRDESFCRRAPEDRAKSRELQDRHYRIACEVVKAKHPSRYATHSWGICRMGVGSRDAIELACAACRMIWQKVKARSSNPARSRHGPPQRFLLASELFSAAGTPAQWRFSAAANSDTHRAYWDRGLAPFVLASHAEG